MRTIHAFLIPYKYMCAIFFSSRAAITFDRWLSIISFSGVAHRLRSTPKFDRKRKSGISAVCLLVDVDCVTQERDSRSSALPSMESQLNQQVRLRAGKTIWKPGWRRVFLLLYISILFFSSRIKLALSATIFEIRRPTGTRPTTRAVFSIQAALSGGKVVQASLFSLSLSLFLIPINVCVCGVLKRTSRSPSSSRFPARFVQFQHNCVPRETESLHRNLAAGSAERERIAGVYSSFRLCHRVY